MDDERDLYRVQWSALRRHLHHLCLGRYGNVLLDALCTCATPASCRQAAIDAWRQRVLADLTTRAHHAAAWSGWTALMPLFGDSERLYHAIAQQADAICQAHASGRTDVLWNVLHAYFTTCRDELDGARTTRL
jgi:hypothetical protein